MLFWVYPPLLGTRQSIVQKAFVLKNTVPTDPKQFFPMCEFLLQAKRGGFYFVKVFLLRLGEAVVSFGNHFVAKLASFTQLICVFAYAIDYNAHILEE